MTTPTNGKDESAKRWEKAIEQRGEPLTDPDNELGKKLDGMNRAELDNYAKLQAQALLQSPPMPIIIPARVVLDGNVEAPPSQGSPAIVYPGMAIKHVITIVPQRKGNQAFQIEVEPGLLVAGTDIILTITKA